MRIPYTPLSGACELCDIEGVVYPCTLNENDVIACERCMQENDKQ